MAKNDGNFEMIVKASAGFPLVRIERESFLRKELSKYCSEDQVETAIKFNPAKANISTSKINDIANKCINYETNKVSAISFASGIPGGIAMIATVPADITQYFGHVIRILQKLIYLYGWDQLYGSEEEMDDETTQMLTLFIGVMFGINGAAAAIRKISVSASQKMTKSIASKALTKGTLYPIVKKVSQTLGIKMTKGLFAKNIAKVVPILGGITSGGLTYISFKPMAHRLKNYLVTLKFADPEFYKNQENINLNEQDVIIME